jgi:beta-lactamase regulating signal transducer with metallopeptidase domain
MILPSLLGDLRIAAWVFSLLTQSVALLLIGWGLAKAARRMAPPLKSGILLALMILLALLPLGITVLNSAQVSLYQLPISPPGNELTSGAITASGTPASPGNGSANQVGRNQDALSARIAGSPPPTGLLDLRSIDPLLAALNVFGLIWLMGFVASVGRLIYGLIFLSGFRSSLVRIPEEELSGAMEAVKAAFPRTRLPSVHTSPAVDSPVALGILRPMIVLPQALVENISTEELISILIHETAHIRHLDQVSGLLQRLLTSFYWWNPLAYKLSASFSLTREDVSDNYAIQKSGARLYANCLVALARKTSLITRLPAAVGMATRYMSLEDRVKNIVAKERVMATQMKKSVVVFLALVAVLLAGLVVRFSWTLTASATEVKTFALPAGIEPQVLAADKDHIYVCEYDYRTSKEPDSHIAIYSSSDFNLLAKIGQVGQNPGEFQSFGPGRFWLFGDQIWALDISKTIVFSRDGVFLKEISIPRDYFAFIYPLIPLNGGFVSLAGDRSDLIKGNARVFGRLYDSDLQFVKEFYGEIPIEAPPPPPPPPAPPGQTTEPKKEAAAIIKREYQAIPDCIDLAVAEDKIFVADTRKGFHVAVFDSSGLPLYEINHDYVSLPVPTEYSSSLRKKLDDTQAWLNKVADIKFRETFPAFYSFNIADGKIYIATYAEKEGLNELVVMNLSGDILKRSFSFPLPPSYDSMYNNFNVAKNRYAISGGKLYYLAKSTAGSGYEVRIQEIK